MAASKFSADTQQAFCEGIFDGLTIAEAAKAAGVAAKTVKNWLTRGRKEGDGPYADFVISVDEARAEHQAKEVPMSYDELKLAVSKSAQSGSAQSQKLYFEMLQREKREGNEPGQDNNDPFGDSDGDHVAGPRALHAV
jgi:hypothetical protein